MSNAILITIIILVAVITILYFILKTTMEKLSLSRMKNTEYEYAIKELKKENSALRDGLNLKAKLEKEANEKIDSLHTGDLSADDILPK
ncbi:MAG: hypothetical protein IJ630_09630 [Treponema sp.]|nr:hypothetical protein [Treponema sp.]